LKSGSLQEDIGDDDLCRPAPSARDNITSLRAVEHYSGRIPTTAFNADRLTSAGMKNSSLQECERCLVSYSVGVTIIVCAGIERDAHRSEHDRVRLSVDRHVCLILEHDGEWLSSKVTPPPCLSNAEETAISTVVYKSP
jgi:hypothetical protein